jgi:hypothetical protein
MQEIIKVRKTAYSQTDWVRVDEDSYITNDAYDHHNYDDKRTDDRTKHDGYGIIGFDENNHRHMVDVGAIKSLELKRIAVENALRTRKRILTNFVDNYYSNCLSEKHRNVKEAHEHAKYAQKIILRYIEWIEKYEIMLCGIDNEIIKQSRTKMGT